jgi:hypothetical protein
MRPIEHLPLPHPREFDPYNKDPLFFYRNFVKPMIPDMIQLMNVGLTIDPVAVEKLRVTIDEVLQTVTDRLEVNPLIKQYQNSRLPEAQRKHAEESMKCIRTLAYYVKPYKPGDMIHRTWVVNHFLASNLRTDDQKDKWTIKELKAYNVFLKEPFLAGVVSKRPYTGNKLVQQAMYKLAQYKLDLWNRPRLQKAEEPVIIDEFNCGSSKQKSEFFALNKIEPLAFSKDTGEPSWGREQLEILLADTQNVQMVDALEAFIDHSYSAIIKNNFLKAFDSFTIDGVLHGNIKLFGAKSFRPTSNNPNLLNAPSTGSIYAKPLKRCIVAPDGKIVYTVDLQGLEDRVIANLSGDTNKQNVFLEGLDGHSLNACGYWPSLIEKAGMGVNTDNVEYVKEFYRRVEEDKNTILKGIRTRSKTPTFKLAYGGFPDADKGGTITQQIFDNYHNVLYPGITKYREEYVLPSTRKKGYIHLGLGCRMYSSNPHQAIRTLNNATVQFWSILTMIAINEFNHQVREEGLENWVEINSTIYDSIYMQVERDPELIKWVNDTIIPILCVQYLEPEVIHNEASGEIGLNWYDLHKIKNNASEEAIAEILQLL